MGDVDPTLDDAVVQTTDPAAPTRQRLQGLVVALAPGLFIVSVAGHTYLCTLRGRLRTSRPQPRPFPVPARTASSRAALAAVPPRAQHAQGAGEQPPVRVAPGDHVLITALSADEGVIEEVLPRRTALRRMRSEVGSEQIMLANLDLAVLVFATCEPPPNIGLLDRYLALCEQAQVAVTICLNKVDLGLPPEVEEIAELYRSLGYPLLYTSATTGAGADELRERLAGKVSLLTGPSGVGKSSLMNMLLPDAGQRIGEISQATGKGRHTTTGVRLVPLAEGGWLADSAGVRELALWNVPAAELPLAFVELRPLAESCLYEDCQHTADEEGCALREALADGRITPGRFASFARLLAEAQAEERPRWESRGH